jgi:predicted lipoprotein with Yx(FWY)xxD motif
MRMLPDASTRTRRAVAIAPLLTVVALAVAGCGGGSSSASMQTGAVAGASHVSSGVVVKTRKVKGKTVLVNAAGHTLYVFAKDKHSRVTCTGSCVHYWPPLKQKGTTKASAGGSAKASLIGSDKNPAGGRVVTYSKWPLYTYVGDASAGSAKGEGLNLSGGKWYVISPSGMVIKSLSSGGGGGGGGGTTTTGGWG